MLRRIREFNDLMTWMDSEFWEQCDEYVNHWKIHTRL